MQGEHRSYRVTPLINNLFAEPKQSDDKVASDPAEAKPTIGRSAATEDSAMPQGPKLYLLKLIEYNKIALMEKYGYSGATALT